MRWEGQVACMEKEKAYKFWQENVKERERQENLDVDGKKMLEWILKK
jgi:hypothetical protein